MLASQGLSVTHRRANLPQFERYLHRTGPVFTCATCSCSRQGSSTGNKTRARNTWTRLALKLGETTATSVLSLSLAAVLVLQHPRPALADSSSSTPPPSTASSSSTASQAASRTVMDVVSGENSILNEENAPDNRQSPDHPQKNNNSPVGDTREVGSGDAMVNGFSAPGYSLIIHGLCAAQMSPVHQTCSVSTEDIQVSQNALLYFLVSLRFHTCMQVLVSRRLVCYAAGRKQADAITAASVFGCQLGWGAERTLSHPAVRGCPSRRQEVCTAVPGAEWSRLPPV